MAAPEIYARVVEYALDAAGISPGTELVLISRAGAAPIQCQELADLLPSDRRVRNTADESELFGPAAEGSPVADGTVLVALGPISGTGAFRRVRLAVYRSMRAATGGTYLVERSSSGWSVTGIEDGFTLG